MDLKDKVIILTGARRIGQTVTEELAKKGAHLAITYRSAKEESEAMCQSCIALGVKAEPFMADLSKEEDIKRVITQIKERLGKVDGLVHMAANFPQTAWEDVKGSDFDNEFQIITKRAAMLGKYVAEEMEDGRIVFISDWAANRAPYKNFAPYLIAKGAIDTVTRVLAVELAPKVSVNAIAPCPILKYEGLTDEENEEVMNRTPLKRWGGAEEIAKAVIYLLEADFVTGVILPVDGGRSIA